MDHEDHHHLSIHLSTSFLWGLLNSFGALDFACFFSYNFSYYMFRLIRYHSFLFLYISICLLFVIVFNRVNEKFNLFNEGHLRTTKLQNLIYLLQYLMFFSQMDHTCNSLLMMLCLNYVVVETKVLYSDVKICRQI